MDRKKFTNKELTILILKLIGAGAILLAVIAMPGIAILLRHLDMGDTPKNRRKLYLKLKHLERKKYLTSTARGFQLSEKAKNALEENAIWSFVPPVKKWDGKWYFVMFDIPAKKERGRQALRMRLEELGYVKYQHSVFVHQHDMRRELLKFATFYNLAGHIAFATAGVIDNEKRILSKIRTKIRK